LSDSLLLLSHLGRRRVLSIELSSPLLIGSFGLLRHSLGTQSNTFSPSYLTTHILQPPLLETILALETTCFDTGPSF